MEILHGARGHKRHDRPVFRIRRVAPPSGVVSSLLMTTCPGFEVAPQAVAIAPDAG